MRLQLRLCGRQWLRAFENVRFRRERDWFAAEDDAVWFFGEIFDEFLSIRGDHFQIQKRHVQLLQLILKPFVSRAGELVRCPEHGVRILGEAIEI